MIYIYGLICPIEKVVRYVGKSIHPERRLERHLHSANKSKHRTANWLKILKRKGLRPELVILRQFLPSEDWQSVERRFIAEGQSLGWRLTNTAAGGEGVMMIHPEQEARRIDNVRKAWKDPILCAEQALRLKEIGSRPEVIEKRRAIMNARWADPVYAEECARLVRESYASPEARQAQSERSMAAHLDPQVKARRSASIKAAWAKEGVKDKWVANLIAGNAKPESKALRSAAMRRRHKDPIFKEKIRNAMADKEMIKRRGQAIKAGWAKRVSSLAECRRMAISDALNREPTIALAAMSLGISRATLYRLAQKLVLKNPRSISSLKRKSVA